MHTLNDARNTSTSCDARRHLRSVLRITWRSSNPRGAPSGLECVLLFIRVGYSTLNNLSSRLTLLLHLRNQYHRMSTSTSRYVFPFPPNSQADPFIFRRTVLPLHKPPHVQVAMSVPHGRSATLSRRPLARYRGSKLKKLHPRRPVPSLSGLAFVSFSPNASKPSPTSLGSPDFSNEGLSSLRMAFSWKPSTHRQHL